MDQLALNSKRPTYLFPRCWNSRYILLPNHVRLILDLKHSLFIFEEGERAFWGTVPFLRSLYWML